MWDHFNRWHDDGTLVAILDRLRGQIEIDEELWCIDGTSIRAAKCAAGGGKRGTPRSHATTRRVAAAAV